MEQQYIDRLADAYLRGYDYKYSGTACPPDKKLHYFKVKDDLPRVEVVLSFLRGMFAAGLCRSLLDVGSGRGAFLFPLLRDFPDLEVTSIDLLPHRVELLDCIAKGGVGNLRAMTGDICRCGLEDKSFDAVSMLEVLEHIPDTEAAVTAAVRLARSYVIVSLPSKPDDNPEHIHLFSKTDLEKHFVDAGCRKVKFMSVTGHHVMVAYL